MTSGAARGAAEHSALASNPLCPPRAAEPRRGEAAKTKRWSLGCRGRRAGSARLSSPSKIYLEERGFTRSASPRGSGGRKVFFSSSSSSSCSPAKDEEKSFKKLLVASQRRGSRLIKQCREDLKGGLKPMAAVVGQSQFKSVRETN